MDELFAHLAQEFMEEYLPKAEEAARAVLELERAWARGAHPEALLARLLADLHSLKGSSAMMGLALAQRAAHALEELCAVAREHPPARGAELADLLLAGTDALTRLVRGAAQPEAPADVEPFLAWAQAAVARLRQGPAAPAQVAAPAEPASPELALQPGADAIRLAFGRLDQMMDLASEAVISEAVLLDAVRRLALTSGESAELSQLEQAAVSLGRTVRLLRERLMEARLLPVANLFGRFERYLRDLSRERGQPLRLVARGGETPIDKTIIDHLGEPLVHLVRNAVAHGIESASERAAQGKPAEGTVALSARLAGDRVEIRVADDGRGLDLAAIRARAVERGLLSGEASGTLSDEEARRLIFLPGFSTAREVSALAGRGVGLDVVDSAVHALGGRVEVESVPGRGTCFVLDLPLTLAVMRSLLVRIGQETYAVPIGQVAESFRLAPGGLHTLREQGLTSWRGAVLPVWDGGAVVGGPVARRGYCVVLAGGKRRAGLLVDALLGHQDIVVKALDPLLGGTRVVSGATVLGDGRVVLVLDAAHLLDRRAAASASAEPALLPAP